jgi:hypothetical protein
MTRRSFFEAAASVAAFFGFTSFGSEAKKINPEGPYSIEVYSPPEHARRELPLFNKLKEAQNYVFAHQSLLQNSGHEAGKILIRTARGEVVQNTAWGETWSSTMVYVGPQRFEKANTVSLERLT